MAPAYLVPITLTQGFLVNLLDAALTTGVAKSQQFCVSPAPTAEDKLIEAVVSGTFTICTVDLEESVDAGVTFQPRQGSTAIDLNTNKAIRFAAKGGVVYRFNVKTFTGTSVTLQTLDG